MSETTNVTPAVVTAAPTTPPVNPPAATPAPAASPAVTKAAKALIPEPKAPAGPSDEAIKAASQVLLEAAKAHKDVGGLAAEIERTAFKASLPADFGAGKPGKVLFTIPETPEHLGHITIHQAVELKNADGSLKKDDKGKQLYSYPVIRYRPGTKHMVTYDEMREIEWRLSRLVHNENVGRFGEKRAKRVELNLNIGQSNPIMNNGSGSEMF